MGVHSRTKGPLIREVTSKSLAYFLLFSLVFIFSESVVNYKAETRDLRERIEKHLTLTKPIVESAIFSRDFYGIADTFDSMLDIPGVVGVSVYDLGNSLIVERGVTEAFDEQLNSVDTKTGIPFSHFDTDIKAYQFGLEHSDSNKLSTTLVGSAVVYVSEKAIVDHVIFSTERNVIVIIFKSFFVWVCFVFIVNATLSRPLSRLRARITDFDDGATVADLQQQKDQCIKMTNNEIDLLESSFIDLQLDLAIKKEALINSKNELEELVRERTKDLELLNEKYKVASEAKSQFLANMSHEIRTPMNGVIGNVELLQTTSLNPKQSNLLESVQYSCGALLSIINDILDFSKIEAGKVELECVEVDIYRVIHEAAKVFALKAKEKKLEFYVDIEKDVPSFVIIDPARLKQVCMNLLNNAFKFTTNGSISIGISRKFNNCSEFLRIEIRDTGIGMNDAQASRLFSAFQQADISTTRKYGGTGLGLSICKQLCELMGGSICVKSRPGKGSAFIAELPLKRGGTIDNQNQQNSGIQSSKILLCADDRRIHDILTMHFEHRGAEVYGIRSTEKLLPQLRFAQDSASPFDFVVIDKSQVPVDSRSLLEIMHLCEKSKIIVLSDDDESTSSLRVLAGHPYAYFVGRPIEGYSLEKTMLLAKQGRSDESKVQDIDTGQMLSTLNRELNILVAEDNAVNQKLFVGFLKKLGLSCDIVCDGEKAINKYMKSIEPYDLVIMDCEMPIMDGWTASKLIRQNARSTRSGKELIIIAASAHATKADEVRARQCGMNDYISKPITLRVLESKIFEAFNEERKAS